MIAFYLLLLMPLFGSLLMLFIGKLKISGICNIAINTANFIISLFVVHYFLDHGPFTAIRQQFYIDAFSSLMIILTTFISMTNAIFSNTNMWHRVTTNRISQLQLLLYNVMYQLFTLIILIAITTNNLGILWVAMEGATLATVLLVGMFRTKEAIEAAWKYFILCIVGIALALFGTVLIYFSATQALHQADTRILWSMLVQHAHNFDPTIIKLAFIFILVGYGTKIGLAPLHNWLPDAYSESPAPITVLLSGLLSNVALYALIRFKILVDLTLINNLSGNLLIGFGAISLIVASVLLQRQRDLKRLYSYSSIEHIGLITIAFGIGGATATFAGLFYLLMHALAKSAIFMIVGNIIQQTNTKILEKIGGLIQTLPHLAWGLIAATLAIAAIPPFAIFTSELMLFIACVDFSPCLAGVLICTLILALSGLLRNIQPIIYGTPTKITHVPTSNFPAFLHLGLILVFGIYIPPIFKQLLTAATKIITG